MYIGSLGLTKNYIYIIMRYLATFRKDFCNNKKIVTLPSKRFTNVTEYVIMHDFFSEQTLKLICICTLLSISD